VAWLLVPLSWVTAALPWLWWLLIATVQRRARWWLPGLAGALCGWLLGSGLHPETAVVAIGSALMAALVLHPRRWRRVIVSSLVTLVVGLALSWPTIAYISSSARLELTYAARPNLEPVPAGWRGLALRQMVLPTVNGHPARGDWRAPFAYAPAATGVGGIVLGVIVFGRVRRRYRRHLLAALACLAVGVLLYLRLPPLDAVLVRLPPFDRMTLPRFAALLPWGLTLWGALAADGALSRRTRHRLWTTLAVTMVGILVVGARHQQLAAADAVLLLVVPLTMLGVLALVERPRLLVALASLELSLYAVGINPVATVEDRLPKPPLVVELERAVKGRNGRVMGIGGVLPANLASRYGLSDLRAYDPLRPVSFARMMAALGQPEPVLGGPLEAAPPGLCGAWSVRYLVAPPDADVAGWSLTWRGADGSLWNNPQWLPEVRVVGHGTVGSWDDLLSDEIDFAETAVVPEGTPEVASRWTRLERVSTVRDRIEVIVRCSGPCLAVVARPWAPGWRVRIDGRPADMVRANLAGLGAVVPEGTHHVEFSYHPWRVALGR
jgi:hypothetical protein